MNLQPTVPDRERAPSVLYGRRLLTVRALWIAVSVLVVGLFVIGLPAYYDQLRVVCPGGDACYDWQFSREGLRAAEGLGLPANFFAVVGVVAQAVFASLWCAVGAVIFWQRSREPGALFVGLFLVVFGAATNPGDVIDALAKVHPVLSLPVQSVSFLGLALLILFFYIFPDGRFVPRRSGWLALAWILVWAPTYFLPNSSLSLDNASPPIILACLLGMLFCGTAAQAYRYRRVSSPGQRQQTKWAVFGVALWIVGFTALILPTAIFPALRHSGTLTYVIVQAFFPVFQLFIPLSIAFAILRSRLWNIDVVINRTLVYGLLTVSLALVYFGGVALLQYVFRLFVGESSQLAIVASTLAIAVLFGPLRRRIQEFIDRLFYRRKYDAAKTLENFSARLRDETDVDALNFEVLSVVRETMQPAHLSLWLREPERRTDR